ncbi:hypothetical protein LTR60_004000, partial [Cryomyces antarcticus]
MTSPLPCRCGRLTLPPPPPLLYGSPLLHNALVAPVPQTFLHPRRPAPQPTQEAEAAAQDDLAAAAAEDLLSDCVGDLLGRDDDLDSVSATER